MAINVKKKQGSALGTHLSQLEKVWQKIVPQAKKEGETLFDTFTNRIGIDLGTATTVAHLDGKGVILREPTLVAVNKRTEQVVAVGKKARIMFGRTPEHIEVIQPVQQGVIYDYEVTEQLFEYIFRRAQDISPKIFGPIVVVGVPCRTSQMEIHAVQDAVIDAGARRAYMVHEPFAAAIGMDLPIESERASMIIDVGGGTSDVMIIAGGEIVANESIRIAGDAFDAAITTGLKKEKQMTIGERTAEDLKVATMQSAKDKKIFSVQGRNIINGLPLEIDVSLDEILNFINPCLEKIAAHIKQFVEKASPEILTDLKKNNIYFVGGGPSVHTFSKKIEEVLNLHITVPENPTAVVGTGTAIIARDPARYSKYFLS